MNLRDILSSEPILLIGLLSNIITIILAIYAFFDKSKESDRTNYHVKERRNVSIYDTENTKVNLFIYTCQVISIFMLIVCLPALNSMERITGYTEGFFSIPIRTLYMGYTGTVVMFLYISHFIIMRYCIAKTCIGKLAIVYAIFVRFSIVGIIILSSMGILSAYIATSFYNSIQDTVWFGSVYRLWWEFSFFILSTSIIACFAAMIIPPIYKYCFDSDLKDKK